MKGKKTQNDALLAIIKEEVKEILKPIEAKVPEKEEDSNEFNKTVEMEALPKFVPAKLKEITLEQTKKLAAWLAERPFKDLIHRQDLINRQVRQAIRKGNSDEENDLRILDAILEKAMVLKNANLYNKKVEKVKGLPDAEKKN